MGDLNQAFCPAPKQKRDFLKGIFYLKQATLCIQLAFDSYKLFFVKYYDLNEKPEKRDLKSSVKEIYFCKCIQLWKKLVVKSAASITITLLLYYTSGWEMNIITQAQSLWIVLQNPTLDPVLHSLYWIQCKV